MPGNLSTAVAVLSVTFLFMSVLVADGIMADPEIDTGSAIQHQMDLGPLEDLNEDDDSDTGNIVIIADEDAPAPIVGDDDLLLGFTHPLKPYCR